MDCNLLLTLPGGTPERLHRLDRGKATAADRLWCCPWRLMDNPDPWQKEVLSDTTSNWILNASRQSGKTTVVAAKALYEAMCCGSFVLVIAQALDQALEFHKRVMKLYSANPVVEFLERPTKTRLLLANGGELQCRPHNEGTVRSRSAVNLLVIDEASRVDDEMWSAVRPMLAVSRGRTCLLSTPHGKRGFFWNEWDRGKGWKRKQVSWRQCPRITPEFIEEEREKLVDVEEEYECMFRDSDGTMPLPPEKFMGLVDHNVPACQSW